MTDKILAGLLTLLLLAVPTGATASTEPMAAIKRPIDEVIEILNDSKYKESGTRQAQRNAIWTVVQPMFDFEEVSRRAVARYWKQFTDAEKKAFVDVFAQFLGNTYIDKIQGEYHNEKIVYLGQEILQEVYAEVKTHIVRETVEIPVNYRMRKYGDGYWRVYDIIVEGVSLVKNYRTQFASILKKKNPSQLIDQLNEKLTEQNQRLVGGGQD